MNAAAPNSGDTSGHEQVAGAHGAKGAGQRSSASAQYELGGTCMERSVTAPQELDRGRALNGPSRLHEDFATTPYVTNHASRPQCLTCEPGKRARHSDQLSSAVLPPLPELSPDPLGPGGGGAASELDPEEMAPAPPAALNARKAL